MHNMPSTSAAAGTKSSAIQTSMKEETTEYSTVEFNPEANKFPLQSDFILDHKDLTSAIDWPVKKDIGDVKKKIMNESTIHIDPVAYILVM